MGHIKPNSKGAKKYRNGVNVNHYCNCHKWIGRNYGKASKCENPNCEKKSNKFHYALRQGCSHEKNINNYIQLCVSCHKKYDWKQEFTDRLKSRVISQETRNKMRLSLIGRKATDETKAKLSARMSGKNNPMYGISISGEKSAWFGKTHSQESKDKMFLSQAKLSQQDIIEISLMHKLGIKQNILASTYGVSKASISRIINKKRYKKWLSLSPQ